MSKVDSLVQDFLAQKKIAVVGVSDNRETGCNLAYRNCMTEKEMNGNDESS